MAGSKGWVKGHCNREVCGLLVTITWALSTAGSLGTCSLSYQEGWLSGQLEQPAGRKDPVSLICQQPHVLTHVMVSCGGHREGLTSVTKKTGEAGLLEGTRMEKHSELITSFLVGKIEMVVLLCLAASCAAVTCDSGGEVGGCVG